MDLSLRVTCLLVLLLAVGVAAGPAAGQGAGESSYDEAGHFFIEAIAATDYPGSTQNWAIVQDDDGVLYVANNQGVMVHDGEHWELIAMPNNSGVRSLAKDEGGRIFVGAQDELGYLAPDEIGSLRFVSLTDELDEHRQGFGDIRSTEVIGEWVYFQAADFLMRWSEAYGFEFWDADEEFGNIFVLDEELYAHHYGTGLMTMRDDSLQHVPGTEALSSDRVQTLTSYPGDRLLIGTFDGQLYLLEDEQLQPFDAEIGGYLERNDLYRIERLSSGHLLMGTVRGGALLVGPEGELIRRITREDGLPGTTVLAIYEDYRGGVWLGFNAGIARIDAPFAFTHFDHKLGLEGLGVAITRHEGRLYVATTSGAFVLETTPRGEPARFRPVEGAQQQCFDLLSTRRGLLAGCGSGILQIDGRTAKLVAPDEVAYSLVQSEANPELVYVGLLDGLGGLRYEDGEWKSQGRVEGVDVPVRSIVEAADDALWLGTDYQGAFRVSFAGGFGREARVERVSTEEELPGGNVSVDKLNADVVLSTTGGFWRVDQEMDTVRVRPHRLYNELLPEAELQELSLEPEGEDTLWFFAQSNDAQESSIIRAHRGADGELSREPTPLQRLADASLYTHYAEDESRVWLSTQNGLVHYDDTVPSSFFVDFPVLIRSVRGLDSDSLLFGGARSALARTATVLPHGQNALRFEYAAPTYTRDAPAEYRVWLEGFDEDWSGWTDETRRDYTNLPGGEYTFHVQAQNAYGSLSEVASYSFRILRPWYASWWAVAGFLLIALGLLIGIGYGIYWYRARKLMHRNRILEQRVEERTHELRQRTRTLERANLELRNANEQKSEFLGIAAHDLKNPLSGIIETSGFLIEDVRRLDDNGALRGMVQEFVPMIHQSSKRMLQIIEDLLQAHVLEEEQSESYFEPVDLADLVYAVLQWNRAQAENKSITLYFKPPGPCEALVDETQMQRVVDNLVSNAIKFSPRQSSVRVQLEKAGETMRITVADEGPGLTEEDKTKIFGKLQRLSAQPTGGEPSNGLGLYIVRELVKNHDGRIYVESQQGEGATFVVEIPTRLGEETAEAEPVA